MSCTDSGGQRVSFSNTCTESEYGNPFDIMGLGPHHTNMVNKARARWASGSNIKEVTASGTYALVPGTIEGKYHIYSILVSVTAPPPRI